MDAYLDRIGYRGSREPTIDTLVGLHRAHMFTVPFENLDIPLGRRITLSLPGIYEKIVVRARGGFCYELNGLFAWLLKQFGFSVDLLSGRVFGGGHLGPDFDHMVLLVNFENAMIADVGFGDSFVEPLRLTDGDVVEQCGRAYRLTESNSRWVLQRTKPGDEWELQYQFGLTPRQLTDFSAMCEYQQTSLQSTFTRKAVCSMATAAGRRTLSNSRLIMTTGDRRKERQVQNEAEYRTLLRTHFGVDLGEDAKVDQLMAIERKQPPNVSSHV